MLSHKIEVGNFMKTCGICSKTMRGDHLKRHMLKHEKGNQYNCELCSAVFTWRASLRRHVREKHENSEVQKEEKKDSEVQKEEKKDSEVLTETHEKRLLWEYEEKKRKIELGRRLLYFTYVNNMNVALLEGEDKEAINMYFEYGHL